MIKLDSGLYADPAKGRIIIPTTNPELYSALPVAEVKEIKEGLSVVTMPLHEDTVKIISNMGINTAGIEPLRYYYGLPLVEGKYPLYDHQIQGAAFFATFERGYNLSTMRVGKTATAVVAADYLQKNKGEHAALVLSTVGNMTGVWEKEIKGLIPNAKVRIVTGSAAERAEILKEHADYYVINYDGVKIMHKQLKEMIKRGQITIAIIDELSHYANHRSDLWKAANDLFNDRRDPLRYVWGLTGTPGNTAEAVYAQVRLITPQNMQMSFTQWRALTMDNPWKFRWVMKKDATEKIEKAMQPAIRFNKDDVFKDIPKPDRVYHYSPLNKEQERVIKEFREDLLALVQGGGVSRLAVADNKAIAVGKILQVCTGAVKVEEDVLRINIDERMADLKALVDESQRKVVIFCAFRETISVVTEYFESQGIKCAESHGGITGRARDKQISAFQDEDSPVKVLVAHPRTTAFGVELAVADTMIFFGPPVSGYMAFAQAVERMSSLKQTAENIRIIYFYGSREEKRAFDAAEKGEKEGAIINELFEEMYYSKE